MSVVAEGFSAAMLFGPLGGVVALAYATGAASGWGFCTATILRITNKQIARLEADLAQERADCERTRADQAREISELKGRVKEVEDRYTHGMERQLGQVRQSSVEVIERGRRKRDGGIDGR